MQMGQGFLSPRSFDTAGILNDASFEMPQIRKTPGSNGDIEDTARLETKYYYDCLNEHILLGKVALEQYLESGGHPADVSELGEFIRSNRPINQKQKRSSELGKLTDQQHLDSLRWLRGVLPAPQSQKQRWLNEEVITRASYLGLVASPRQLSHPKRFGSISNVFRQLGDKDNNIRYHDLTTDKAISYIKNFHDLLGRMPSYEELKQRASLDTNSYSIDVLMSRIPGGLSRVAEELGYVNLKTDEDYLTWGVEFFIANDFRYATQDSMNLCASVKKGPSHASIKKRWSINYYNQKILSAFEAQQAKFADKLKTGELPAEIVNDDSLLMTISNYIKFSVIEDLLPNLPKSIKIGLSRNCLSDIDFIKSLARYKNTLNWSTVNEVSKKYGTFKNMWRIDYINSLCLETVAEKKLDTIRGELDEPSKNTFQDAIDNTADYLIANNKSQIQPGTIATLQKYQVIPKDGLFKQLFHSNEIFMPLVLSRYRKKIKQIKLEEDAAKIQLEAYRQTANIPPQLYHNLKINGNAAEVNRAWADFIRKKASSGEEELETKGIHLSDMVLSPHQSDVRTAKLMLVDALLNIPLEEKLILCVLERRRNFIGEIRRNNPAVTMADIEHMSELLGIHELLFESRKKHLDDLRNISRKNKNELARRNYKKRRSTTKL